MKLKLSVLAALGCLLVATPAGAIEGPRAVRHIKRLVEANCYSDARANGATCLGWRVWHCYKLGSYKVRCRSYQEYRKNGNWRICYFTTAAVERRDRSLVDLHFGRGRCYSESGAPIR